MSLLARLTGHQFKKTGDNAQKRSYKVSTEEEEEVIEIT